jgi:UDP-N-acetylmuramate: L-alanyl-gamma-D-glutamyl-meso-diaminopimelate ligase
MHYHLIGIAGTAMGSLAGLLRAKGHRVTGSDQGVYPPHVTRCSTSSASKYARDFDPQNLEPAPDVVVVGNAISRGNVRARGGPGPRAHARVRARLNDQGGASLRGVT